MQSTSKFLDAFYERLTNEISRVNLAIMEATGGVREVIPDSLELYKEAITVAFINPTISEFFNDYRPQPFAYREIARISSIVKNYIYFYDAIKTYYMFRCDEYPIIYRDNPLTLIEMKVLFSELFNARCEFSGVDPQFAHDLRFSEVPPIIVLNLRRYVGMFRGAVEIPTDPLTHLVIHSQLLACLKGAFDTYNQFKERGYEPEA